MAGGINGFLSSVSGSINQYASGITSGVLGNVVNSATQALASALGLPGTPDSIIANNALDSASRAQTTYQPNSCYLVTIHQSTANGGSRYVQAYYDAETLGFQVGGSYDAPFAQGLLSLFNAPMLESLATVAGVKAVTKDMTALLWQGATRPSFSIPLVFFNRNEPAAGTNPIIDQMSILAQMALPSVDESGFLTAPGPQRNFDAAAQQIQDQANNLALSGSGAFKGLSDAFSNPTKQNITQALTGVRSVGQQFTKGFSNVLSALTGGDTLPTGSISVTIGSVLTLESVIVDSVEPNIDFQFDNQGRPIIARCMVHCTPYKIWAADDFVKAMNQGGTPQNVNGNTGATTFPLDSPGAISNVPAGLGVFGS